MTIPKGLFDVQKVDNPLTKSLSISLEPPSIPGGLHAISYNLAFENRTKPLFSNKPELMSKEDYLRIGFESNLDTLLLLFRRTVQSPVFQDRIVEQITLGGMFYEAIEEIIPFFIQHGETENVLATIRLYSIPDKEAFLGRSLFINKENILSKGHVLYEHS